jgi:hypothetical protein
MRSAPAGSEWIREEMEFRALNRRCGWNWARRVWLRAHTAFWHRFMGSNARKGMW